MLPNDDFKAVCTVTALAKKLGLSRTRVYQLLKMGIFPPPVYCIRTKRPFYPLELQQKCMDIRETGIGLDGRPVFFNTPRKTKTSRAQNGVEPQYKELAQMLKQLGLNVSPRRVKSAAKALCPEGLVECPTEKKVIVEFYNHLNKAS